MGRRRRRLVGRPRPRQRDAEPATVALTSDDAVGEKSAAGRSRAGGDVAASMTPWIDARRQVRLHRGRCCRKRQRGVPPCTVSRWSQADLAHPRSLPAPVRRDSGRPSRRDAGVCPPTQSRAAAGFQPPGPRVPAAASPAGLLSEPPHRSSSARPCHGVWRVSVGASVVEARRVDAWPPSGRRKTASVARQLTTVTSVLDEIICARRRARGS